MRAMPRLLLLLFCMSVVTMMFIARCGLSMDSQLHSGHPSGLPVSAGGTPGEKALREVMRRKEVEHIRDKTLLQEKIRTLESQLVRVQDQVVNLTANLQVAESTLGRYQSEQLGRQNLHVRESNGLTYHPENAGNNLLRDGHNNYNRIDKNDARLGYPSDGLNPVPRYRPQNDKWPGFVHDTGRLAPMQGQIINRRQDTMQQLRINQFENDAHKLFNTIQASEQKVYLDKQKMGHYEADFNLAANQGVLKMAEKDEEAVRGGVYPVMAGNSRYERSVLQPGETSDANQFINDSLDKHGEMGPKTRNASEGPFDYGAYIQDRLHLAEIHKGQPYKTEYELIPFNRFIFNRIFMVDPGLGKRVAEKPIGSKKKDLNEILYHAVETLNKNRSQNNLYTYDDFVEGIYRSDPASGSHYELFFFNRDEKTASKHPHSYIKLSIVRPFAPPMTVQQNILNTGSEWINIILPLSKRLDTFRIFIDQFVTVCIKRDKRIYLTVVYFGADDAKEVKSIMGYVAKTHKFKHMKLVTLNETFARGRGLQIGALNWKGGDVLLFFCDVDIIFTPDFLERCRLNSEKGQKVYYPIVFSLYNPKIVYSLQDLPIPSLQDQLIISKDTGFWRDFGYGMTCLYRSDFLKIKGFDEQITGWGGEDVFLYQKFVRSDYFVIRATDPAIFHLWHEKYCDPNLSAEQYRSCIRSKALNEASHAQLGLLAFKDEIDVHRGISERNSILIKNANAEGRDTTSVNGLDAHNKKV